MRSREVVAIAVVGGTAGVVAPGGEVAVVAVAVVVGGGSSSRRSRSRTSTQYEQ